MVALMLVRIPSESALTDGKQSGFGAKSPCGKISGIRCRSVGTAQRDINGRAVEVKVAHILVLILVVNDDDADG